MVESKLALPGVCQRKAHDKANGKNVKKKSQNTDMQSIHEQIGAVSRAMNVFNCRRQQKKPRLTKGVNLMVLELLLCPFIIIFTFFFVLLTFLLIMWIEYFQYNVYREFGNGLCATRSYYSQRSCQIVY